MKKSQVLFYMKYWNPELRKKADLFMFFFIFFMFFSMFYIGILDVRNNNGPFSYLALIGGGMAMVFLCLISPFVKHEMIITSTEFIWRHPRGLISKETTIIPMDHFESILLSDKSVYLVLKDPYVDNDNPILKRSMFSDEKLKRFLGAFKKMKIHVGKYGE